MLIFWISAALLTTLTALLMLAGARRATGPVNADDTASEAARRELGALDRLRAEGAMGEREWAESRAEAARRLLAASTPAATVVIGRREPLMVLGGVVLTAATALGLYFALAAPGQGDQPFAARVEAWAVSTEPLEPAQAAAVIEREVRLAPDDLRMLTLLGSARFQAGDPVGAASAFRRALAINPNDGQSWARLGESLVRASDGRIGPDSEAAFREALKHDPGQLGALYFLGEAAETRGEAPEVRRFWTPLIAALDASDPRRTDLERRLAALEAGR
ncbi:c-type cytochrome biogenesis protein CcmI [Brevundimonas sp. VNH65]|uniref:c-type cytochrome biogenesis protein CcmI n=1 Tax=Brevundimonas sp. VNH65 TaxID=3400917 RepID=UPI003C0055B5